MTKPTVTRLKAARRASTGGPAPPSAAGAVRAVGAVREEDDDLPLLESMQELVKREKLALEYQLVEKEETIIMLTEKCKALEKGSASEIQRKSKSGRQRPRLWPGTIKEENLPLIVDHQLALSNRGLNARRLAVVNKQYHFLKKQVEGVRLDGNHLEDTCIEGVVELLRTKPLRHVDLSGNNFAHKGGSMLLACLRADRDLAERLEVLRLETNDGLSCLPGFGADVARVLKELWDKKTLQRLYWLALTLQDYHSPAAKPPPPARGAAAAAAAAKGAKAVKAPVSGLKKGAKGGGKKDPFNALAFTKFLRHKDRPPLCVLELRHARLSLKSVDAMCHVDCLRSLTHLDLCNAMMGAAGALALSTALATHADKLSLTSLSLAGNCIADFGARALSTALGPLSTLTALDVRHNYITDSGAGALLGAIEANRHVLVSLRLAHNRLTSSVLCRCLRLVRLPGSALLHVDVEGQAGGVALRSELQAALADHARVAGAHQSGRSDGGQVVHAWRPGQVVQEAFRTAGKDLHVKLLSLPLTDSHLEVEHTQVGEGEGATVVRLAWEARRREGDGATLSWKVCRERNGDVTVLARGVGGGERGGEAWQEGQASVTGLAAGETLLLLFCACDASHVPLPRPLLAEAGGSVEVRGLRVSVQWDTRHGLLCEDKAQDAGSERQELVGMYSERAAGRVGAGQQGQERERRELWRLFLELGDGRYFCVSEVFVGSGPEVHLSWEAWVCDEEDGVALPFTWALLRRSFGSSELVLHGTAAASEPECWVALEASVGGCMPGDVLVLWLGVLEGGGGRGHVIAPFVRHVRLRLRQSEDDKALLLKQRRALPHPVAYASGYPVGTLERNVAWGL